MMVCELQDLEAARTGASEEEASESDDDFHSKVCSHPQQPTCLIYTRHTMYNTMYALYIPHNKVARMLLPCNCNITVLLICTCNTNMCTCERPHMCLVGMLLAMGLPSQG